MPPVLVDAAELGRALNSLKPLAKRGRAGEGSFTLTDSAVCLRWAGAEFLFGDEATGTGGTVAKTALVPEAAMLRLGSALPKQGSLALEIQTDRFRIGSLSLPARIIDEAAPLLIAANASALDLALLPFQKGADEIARAGLTDQVAEVQRKRDLAVTHAASKLKWLGIDAELLGKWVKAHLEAKARGETTFQVGLIVADSKGQVSLFSEPTR